MQTRKNNSNDLNQNCRCYTKNNEDKKKKLQIKQRKETGKLDLEFMGTKYSGQQKR